MKHNTLPSRPAVGASHTEYCPECRHRMDDYNLSHYPDCRYFWVDTESDDELDIALLGRSGVLHSDPISTCPVCAIE